MSKQTVEERYALYENGRSIKPFIPTLVYSDAITTGFNKITVTASATNETLAITDIGTVVALELRVKPADVSKLTVKYNGDADDYPVSPIEKTSEPITDITGSNSSTSDVDLYWRATYQ